jgi:hypothetical protein
MKKTLNTPKVILELYMEIWHCYEDGKSMGYPLFTSTSYEMAEAEAKEAGYEVVQVIEFVDEEETSPEPSPIGKEVEGFTDNEQPTKTLRQLHQIEVRERAVLDSAYGLNNQLERLNEIDPIAAGNTYKCVLQYLQEKNTTKTIFTIKELEQLGYLPTV